MLNPLAPPPPYVVPTKWGDVITHLGLQTNLRIAVDAGDAASYSGSGTVWNDVSGSGHNFNFDRWTGSIPLPTFNGTAGRQSVSEYMSYFLDGSNNNNYFTLATANPSWMETMHKANGKGTLCQWTWYNNHALFGYGVAGNNTNASAVDQAGWAFVMAGASTGLPGSPNGGAFFLITRAGAATVYEKILSKPSLTTGWEFCAVSWDFATGVVNMKINGLNGNFTSQSMSSPSANNAEARFQIGSGGNGQRGQPNNSRHNCVAVWDRALSAAELELLFNATRAKFGV